MFREWESSLERESLYIRKSSSGEACGGRSLGPARKEARVRVTEVVENVLRQDS